MIKTQFIILISSIIICSMGCKEKSQEDLFIEMRHDEIMVIHDDVMPKISDIHKLSKAIKKKENPRLRHFIDSLASAEDAMMEWMHNYDKPSKLDADYETYLDNQEQLIKEVRDKMLHSIAHAQKALNDD